MILDGEQNEAVRILLKKWLACFKFLDTRNSLWGFFDNGLLHGLLDHGLNVLCDIKSSRQGRVFFVRWLKVELFDRRVTHLEFL
jgi:hypothetical protein